MKDVNEKKGRGKEEHSLDYGKGEEG